MGSGPISEEMKAYTAEGVPSAPPHDALCTTLTAQTIRVSWVSPPLASANGVIKGYKVIYGPSDSWYGEYSRYFFLYEPELFKIETDEWLEEIFKLKKDFFSNPDKHSVDSFLQYIFYDLLLQVI